MKKNRVIISGGGTGGHIYPAIAIADELKKRHPDMEFLFVGARDRMEMEKVPKAGYKIKGLWISGIQRKMSLKNLALPFKLMHSLRKAHKIINDFEPCVAIGTGGYASGPLLSAASKKGIPTLLQEQNSYAGMTNKWLAGKASTICVAYENMERYFPKEKIVFTGNPIRGDLLEIESKRTQGIDYFKLDPNKKTVLILGGSLGARSINELGARSLSFFKSHDIQLIWQCGKLYFEEFKKYDEEEHVKLHQFLERMDLAYAAADIILSRAGAISVSELCIVGKPTIFIPSPNVAEDHQTKNAEALARKGAALMIEEAALETEFEAVMSELIKAPKQQQQLAENIKKRAKPHATSDIVDEVEKLIKMRQTAS